MHIIPAYLDRGLTLYHGMPLWGILFFQRANVDYSFGGVVQVGLSRTRTTAETLGSLGTHPFADLLVVSDDVERFPCLCTSGV
jgi:hypothetical protein